MIKIIDGRIEGSFLPPAGYIKKKDFLTTAVSLLTRHLRAHHAVKAVAHARRLLDIGCGDGYFLKRVPCPEKYGLDELLGDRVVDRLDFPDGFFDTVTMLATLTYLPDPQGLFKEIHRVLGEAGRLVLTTPKAGARTFLKWYAKNAERAHTRYFDYSAIENLAGGLFVIERFDSICLGLNQVYCLRKCA